MEQIGSLSVFESDNLHIGDRLDMALESQVLPEIQDALKDDEIRQQQINKDLEALIEIPDDSDDSIGSDDDAPSNRSNQSSEENFQTQEFCENNGAENSYAGENGYSRSHESSCMYNRHYSPSQAESGTSSRSTYEDDNSKGDQVSGSRSWGVNGHLENGSLSGGNYPHDLIQHPSPESSRELEMKYRELEILYNEACANLQMLKEAECIYKENTEQEIRIFKQNTALLDEKLRRYNSNLQKANDLISEHKNEKNKLSERISLLESELTLANQAKEEAMGKLSGSKALIQSLENKVSDLNRFDNISQVRKKHDKMVEEMKSCHHKEMSKKIKEIDELKENLESKDQTVQDLRQKNKEDEDEIEMLLLEKNKLLRELAESQRHCQAYFKSGTLEEVSSLKLEICHLKKEKQYIELKNVELSNGLKCLKAELEAIETQEKLCSTHEHSKQFIEEKGKIDLVSELKKSIENTKTLRSENKSLKNRLQINEKKYTELQEMIKVRESHLTNSEEKIKELEAEICKLQSIENTTGKICDSIKIKDLEYKLKDMKTKLYDAKDKLKKSCQQGDILAECNRKLEERISSLIQEHLNEKKNAVEECRVKCLAIHNAELQKSYEKRDAEIKDLCFKYDNELSLKEKELKAFEDELHDSKKQYVRLFEEKRSIQLKLDSISMPKERVEIENELKSDYEKKLKLMKEDLYKEVSEFVENTKQALDAKFQSCLQEEQLSFQKKLDSLKSELHEKYQERIDNLRGRFQSENDVLKTQCEQLQSKFKNEFIQLKAVHENETKLKEFEFQKKLQNMQNEMQSFKENMALRLQEGEEINVLKHDFMCQKEKWEGEKSEFNKKEQNWTEQLKLNAEKEVKFESKIKKYKCYITSLESKQKEKINQLQSQISDLEKNYDAQRNELVLLREYKLKDVFKKSNKNSWCQTEESFVSEQKYLNMESKFFECLENITVSIKNYAAESKKRYEDSLGEALMNYHNQISQRMLQGVSRDIHTFTPTILLPQTQAKSVSDSTFPFRIMPHNGFKTISPPAEKLYPQTTPYQPIPDTKYSSVFSMFKHSEESCAGKHSSFKPSSFKTSTPALDGWCADAQKHTGNRTSFERDIDHPTDRNSRDCEINLEDFSYDFLPMGLFEHKNMLKECPEKL